MKINKEKFFVAFKQQFPQALNQEQVDGLNAIIDALAEDKAFNEKSVTTTNQVAYILATIKHECANEWHPIDEYGRGKGRAYGKPDAITGKAYYGRGFVQLTWKANYQKLTERLNLPNVDLVRNPELAKDPAIAWAITSVGMREGLFTGRSLDRYINASTTDFVNARKIINGLDKANTIANYARQFAVIIGASLEA